MRIINLITLHKVCTMLCLHSSIVRRTFCMGLSMAYFRVSDLIITDNIFTVITSNIMLPQYRVQNITL